MGDVRPDNKRAQELSFKLNAKHGIYAADLEVWSQNPPSRLSSESTALIWAC